MPIPPKPTVNSDLNAWGGKANALFDALTPKTDGKIVKNVGGTLTEVAVEDEVAGSAAVTAVTPAAGEITAGGAAGAEKFTPDQTTGEEVRRDHTGTFRQVRGPHVNLADALDPVAADHSAVLKALWDANGDGYTYHIPDGMDVKLPLQNYTLSLPPRLRSHLAIIGEGPGSRILVTGFTGASQSDPAYAGIVHTHYDATGPVEDVLIENLTVAGDGPTTPTWNNQAAAIRFAPDAANPITRTMLRRVVFLNINGFPLHSDGVNDTYTTTEACHIENCGNGVNMNGQFYSGIRDTFKNSEGYECSGAGLLIAYPLFEDIFSVAISAGGNQGTGAFPGARIIGPRVLGVRGGTGLGNGIGIILAESMPDTLVLGAYVERTYGHGFQTTAQGTAGANDGAAFVGCAAVNCGNSVNLGISPGSVGFYLVAPNGRLIGSRAYNRVANASDPYPLGTSRSLIGAVIQGTGCVIDGCALDMSNGGTSGLQLKNTATGTIYGTNKLGGAPKLDFIAGASLIDASRIGTDIQAKTTAYTSVNTDRVVSMDCTGATRNIVVHRGAGLAGKRLTCMKTDATANALTVTPASGETINGSASALTLTGAYATITLLSVGTTDWLIESSRGTVS